MAEGRHLENRYKLPYLNNSLTDCHEIWHNDAFLPSAFYQPLKFRIFSNPRWQMAAILKDGNLHISATLPITTKFGIMTCIIDPLHPIGRVS